MKGPGGFVQAAKPHFPNTEPPFDHVSCFDMRLVVDVYALSARVCGLSFGISSHGLHE